MNFFDMAIIHSVHFIFYELTNFFYPLAYFLYVSCDNGLLFVVISFILLLRKKTRWIGATIILSILIGGVINSVVLKNLIMRIRPYLSTNNAYYQMWLSVGAIETDGYSFPSGHVMAVSACMFSFTLCSKKENRHIILVLTMIFIVLMSISRIYLLHHYPTDCIAGVFLGLFSAIISVNIVKRIFDFFIQHKNNKFFNFILNFNLF